MADNSPVRTIQAEDGTTLIEISAAPNSDEADLLCGFLESEGMSEMPAEPPRERHAPEEPHLPRWVPTLIGAVLVTLAALAVYTGVRYRNPTLADGIIRSKRSTTAVTGGGPPGEPGPGASLV